MNDKAQFPLVTIDSASTRDIDDAFSLQPLTGGGIELVVAIADASAAVPVGGPDDLAAQALAATVYVRDSPARRMLPPAIAEDRASLVQGRIRDAMLLRLHLDPSWAVSSFAVEFSKVTVTHRLSYEEIPALIRDKNSPVSEMLGLASAVATELIAKRQRAGALALFDAARRVMTDEEGRLLQVPSSGAMVGHLIIQEFMIAANASMAQYMVNQNIPGLYRNHVPQLAAPLAADLARSLQAWLASGAADTSAITSQLAAAVGRALYEPTLGGHYGLALACYTHGTSPLRRYADLVNQRQLKAHVVGHAFPYTQERLHQVARSINQTLADRREDVAEGYKQALRKKTEAALSQDRLSGAQDHVLVEAIGLMAVAGTVDAALADELQRRMELNTLADKVADALIAEWPLAMWPQSLANRFVNWVAASAPRGMHLILHGRQVGALGTVDVQTKGGGTDFESVCMISKDKQPFTGRATGTRKKEAEQQAVIAAIAAMLGCRAPEPSVAPTDGVATSRAPNPKGALLEFLQARSWPFPDFEHTVKGPPHAPQFIVRVSVETSAGGFAAEGAGTSKKHAEAEACSKLLGEVSRASPATAVGTATVPSDNPVGALQERAQQRKVRMPEYAIRTKQINPPIFEALVTLFEGSAAKTYSGFASSKSDAKRLAAAKALQDILIAG
ncbi:RNB domain-containing ribonuclease [Acidovorax sp.]|uniref:RNB domain-containing ribonuclease n=1 Tax=Acidovorax sp. TaxID=1872122 RepID=UPI00391FA48C